MMGGSQWASPGNGDPQAWKEETTHTGGRFPSSQPSPTSLRRAQKKKKKIQRGISTIQSKWRRVRGPLRELHTFGELQGLADDRKRLCWHEVVPRVDHRKLWSPGNELRQELRRFHPPPVLTATIIAEESD